MDRIIALSDIRKAVDDAYQQNKTLSYGEIDPRLDGVNPDQFGISVVFADGFKIEQGNTDAASPMGNIVKMAIASLLLEQNSPETLMNKSGQCCCKSKVKPGIGGAKGIRAVSALQPTGDPDSKWNLIENRMIDLMGSAPELDDKLYKKFMDEAKANDDVNKLAESGFFLYDDAAMSIELYRRAQAMTATTTQLATMGATIAADGVNPVTKAIVFDGELSKRIVAMMAAKGPHKMTAPWNIMSGLPAKSSFGGAIVGVYPGVMSIAAYSPRVMPNTVSARAAKAITGIMNALDISVFQSAKIIIDKER